MIITSKPDGWPWNPGERGPAYMIVQLPGVDEMDIIDLLKPEFDDTNTVVRRRRRYRVDTSRLTAAVLEQLADNRVSAITRRSALVALSIDMKET
jgi:hypothetical protein